MLQATGLLAGAWLNTTAGSAEYHVTTDSFQYL
jgi:hypothetical protein